MNSFAFVSPTPIFNRSFITGASSRTPIMKRARVAAYPISAQMSLKPIFERAKEDIKVVATTTGKVLSVAALIAALAFPLDPASAARGGGRVGGSNFRSAPAPRAAPSRGYSGGYTGGYGYGGGGFFSPGGLMINPFIMPFGGFGMGFGGLGTFLIIGAVASILSNALETRRAEDDYQETVNPTTAVTVLKVGLLASARSLQVDLDMLARAADTATSSGLRYVLAETVTSLLRHPDYWAFGSVDVQQARLNKAEDTFNTICMQERLKLKEETLVNSRGQKLEKPKASATTTDLNTVPNEYIIVSLIVAASGDLITKMPKNMDSVTDLNRALSALGGVSKDSLQGVEVIWAPQSLKDTVTEQELLQDHPELNRL